MYAIWKGIISFGSIDIPVALYKTTEEHGDLVLHQVHARDGSPVRRKLWCEEEDREIEYREVAKGYQHPDGRKVVLGDKDLASLPLPSRKQISVLACVDSRSIDPMVLGQAYYVGGADPIADRAYVLLREALRQSGQVAVTRAALGTRESPAVLRAHGDILVLQVMNWPEEIRHPTGIAPKGDVAVRPQELKMARSFMDILSEGFDLDELHDDYRQALRQVIAARLEEMAPPYPGDVTDLTAALRSSMEAAANSRSGAAPTRRTAAKKAASAMKKATAGKKPATGAAAAKKTAARRTAARRATPRRAS